jgi:RNA polymerase sigma-70 factor (ECF subfamily)
MNSLALHKQPPRQEPDDAADRVQHARPEAAASLRHGLALLLPELRTYARFLVRDRSKSDDLVQDTVVRALASIAQFQEGTSLKAWVFTILRNAAFEQVRRRRREDAALVCRVPVGTMRARVSRARAKLAAAFAEGAPPWEA